MPHGGISNRLRSARCMHLGPMAFPPSSAKRSCQYGRTNQGGTVGSCAREGLMIHFAASTAHLCEMLRDGAEQT